MTPGTVSGAALSGSTTTSSPIPNSPPFATTASFTSSMPVSGKMAGSTLTVMST